MKISILLAEISLNLTLHLNKKTEIEEIPWNELDKDTYRDEKTSRRLAVCNMDWDRIKAVDLYVIFNSFKPAQGVLKSIKVSPNQ